MSAKCGFQVSDPHGINPHKSPFTLVISIIKISSSASKKDSLAIIASELVAITASLALFPLLVAPVRAVPVPVAQPGLVLDVH